MKVKKYRSLNMTQVGGPDEEQPVFGGVNPVGLVRVYDARTGKRLITGPKILIMPRPNTL